MALKELFVTWCVVLVAVKNLGGQSENASTATWRLMNQQVVASLLDGLTKKVTEDDKSSQGRRILKWAFVIWLVPLLIVIFYKTCLMDAIFNAKRKRPETKMTVSNVVKEKNKKIYQSRSSKKQEKRHSKVSSAASSLQETTRKLNDADAIENTPKGKKKKMKNRRKNTALPEITDDMNDWQTVKKKHGKKNSSETVKKVETKEKIQTEEIKEKYTKAEPLTETRTVRRNFARPARDTSQDRLRKQWLEDKVEMLVEVPPGRRHHVIGTRGDEIGKLLEKYPALRVSVPTKEDLSTAYIKLNGPKSQVAAAREDILGNLRAIDEELREAARRRKANMTTVVSLEVDPQLRRYIVGPQGERLRRLAKEHPKVRVSVPAPNDTNTRSVTIRGPTEEVTAVQISLKNTLQTAQQQVEARAKRRTKLQVAERQFKAQLRRDPVLL